MSISNDYTVSKIILKTVPFLAGKGIPNPRLEADLMLAHVLNLPRIKLYTQWDRLLNTTEIANCRDLVQKRAQGWPLAYLTGKKSFLSWEFMVTPVVLIPRPETELLVEVVQEYFKNHSQLQGIDVGTGSGILAITLAKLLPNSTWQATDLSKEALAIAAENAQILGVESQIRFIEGDLLEPFLSSPVKYDLIVANPPYIPTPELASLQTEVKKEPVLALDGGGDGLAVYRRLFPQALTLLSEEGVIAVEHGFNQRAPLEKILTDLDFTCRSYQDLAGLERVLLANKV